MSCGSDAAAVPLHGMVRRLTREVRGRNGPPASPEKPHQLVGKGERGLNELTDGTVCSGGPSRAPKSDNIGNPG
jgi:hypothetical protein